jgi:aminoglycoside 6'-N-acetyltransferase I
VSLDRPGIRIRYVAPADADQWRDLRVALWPEAGAADLASEVARYFQEPREAQGPLPEAVLVAVGASGTPPLLGFAELSLRSYAEGCATSPVGFLEGWYVVPERRREGIGGALVAAAESWARERGCLEFASDALAENAVSAAAHRALAFEEVGLIRCFRKTLAPSPHAGGGSGA